MPATDLENNETRDRFRYFSSIPTRWMDNDIYGHVNNVVYYAYFDTLITRYLIVESKVDILGGPVVPFTVESMCRYLRSFAFPDTVEGGLRVGHLGNSSVRYEIGLFRSGEPTPAALGYFVDVFVDRSTQRPVPILPDIRVALERLLP